MTDRSHDPIGPRIPPEPARHIIDPMAFALAFVAAPLIPALALCWLIVPAAAVFFGGPLWLLLGLPVLLWQMPRTGPDCAKIALLALLGNLAATLEISGYLLRNGTSDALGSLLIYGAFGSLMSLIWGALFAWLYRILLPKLRSDLERVYRANRPISPPDPRPHTSFAYQA